MKIESTADLEKIRQEYSQKLYYPDSVEEYIARGGYFAFFRKCSICYEACKFNAVVIK